MVKFDENEQKSSQSESHSNTPGEYYIIAGLLLVIGTLFVDSLKLPGIFQGFTVGTGVLPQVMTAAVSILLLFISIQMIKVRYIGGKLLDTLNYLFSKEVLILIFGVVLYGILMKYLHFKTTTFLFLWSIMYLLDSKQPLNKFLISLLVLIGILLIFSTVFRVLLP